jgi:hypothetical protein
MKILFKNSLMHAYKKKEEQSEIYEVPDVSVKFFCELFVEMHKHYL